MSQRRWRSGGPPPRLGWPAGAGTRIGFGAVTKGKNGEDAGRTFPSKSNKRGRQEASSSQQQQAGSLLWTDAYAPLCLEDVCVAPKKVKEVSQWIQQSLLLHSNKLLILVGSPGIGKSAMIRLIAQESKLQISEWNEPSSSYISDATSGGGVMSSVDQQSALASFHQFLQQSGVGFHALTFGATTSATTGKSKKATPTTGVLHLASIDNQDTMRSSCSPTKKQRTEPSQNMPDNCTLILIEEIPNLYSTEAEEEFRDIMDQHIRQSLVPTVLIVSNVVEGKCRPDQLERWVSHSLLYGPHVTIMQIHPPTKMRFQRVLQRIAKGQGFVISKERAEQLHEETSGDVRAAIGRLQCEYTGRGSIGGGGGRHHRKMRGRTVPPNKRLSTFHALGKLLYAKRMATTTSVNDKNNSSIWEDTRGPLEFDPELVVDQSEMELGGVLHFVQFHCVDFFEDLSELSHALDYFSDAAFWLDRPNTQPAKQYSAVRIDQHLWMVIFRMPTRDPWRVAP